MPEVEIQPPSTLVPGRENARVGSNDGSDAALSYILISVYALMQFVLPTLE